MPHRAFIGIGSNLGDRAGNYREAIQKIAAIPGTRVVRQSSIYETEPVGDELMLKWPFLNGVVEAETDVTPENLMKRLLTIERGMGRKPFKGRKAIRGKYRPRIIDLDRRYAMWSFSQDPSGATDAGIHQYDALLADYSPATQAAQMRAGLV